MNQTELAREAAMAAARLRAEHGYKANESLCPYDLAKKLGVVVHLKAIPTLEGMYSPKPTAAIILGANRPAGRRRYTCAHEIGHHVFKHGYKIDQLDESNSSPWSPDEFIAQRFAGALLMPKLAISAAFQRRGWQIHQATAEQVFTVSQEFGVGYTTLITHLEFNFGNFPKALAETLKTISLKKLRASMAGFDVGHDLFVVDKAWSRSTVDVEVGDIILIPANTAIEGKSGVLHASNHVHIVATIQGTSEIKFASGEVLMLRVSRRDYDGLARYRHLEETDDE